MRRNRLVYFCFLVTVIALGLGSRHYSSVLPQWVKLYMGDALWALMVFIIIGLVLNRKGTLWVGSVAYIFSFCIEVSQLYHAPWIDAIRMNRLGGLILGFGFLWSDLVCYAVGIGIGNGAEQLFLIRDCKD